jgi:replicative DNA helicase
VDKDSKYAWNARFRERIIALCFVPDWYASYGDAIIMPEYLETEEEQELVGALRSFYKAYGRPPEEDEILAEFSDDTRIQDLILTVLEYLDEDLTYAQEQAVQFAKEQAMKLAILASVKDIHAGHLSKPIMRVREALAVGMDLRDLGILLKEDVAEWNFDSDDDERIVTGMPLLDKAMGGGLSRGEYGVVLGSSNVGKTRLLINFGVGAASIMQRLNVVHITLEMKAKKIAQRYGARIVGKKRTYDTDLSDYALLFDKSAKVKIPGQIRVKGWPPHRCTINDLSAYLNRLIMSGYVPDLLIVDYPDIMKHEKVGELRHNISNTTAELRGCAGDFNLAVWGASQANRGAVNRELVDLDAIAEDYGKVAIADIIIAICQTKEEYELDLLRLFAAKVREGPKHWVLRCSQLGDIHAIVELEMMTLSQIAEAKEKRKNNSAVDEEAVMGHVAAAVKGKRQ